MSGPALACFITYHGFGHASRSLAVLTKLHALKPDLHFRIFSEVPHWFLAENLDSKSFEHHKVMVDVGLVQANPFKHDLPSTINRLDEFLPFSKDDLNPIVETLKSTSCSAVLCDVSALGIAAGQKAGLPTILLENFTWDWMYEEYLDDFPTFSPKIDILRALYNRVDLRLQTEPICNPLPAVTRISPIARPFRASKEKTRAILGTQPEDQLVLLTTGGIRGDYSMKESLLEHPDTCFLLSGSKETLRREANLIHIPHQSGHHYPDLVRASDAIVGKAGYGTVAEVMAAGIPFARILRENFRESQVLGSYLDKEGEGFAMSPSEFASASWLNRLEELLAYPRKKNRQLDGAAQAAEHIAPYL